MTTSQLSCPTFLQWLSNSTIIRTLLPSLLMSGLISLLLSQIFPLSMYGVAGNNANTEIWLIFWAMLFPIIFIIAKLAQQINKRAE